MPQMRGSVLKKAICWLLLCAALVFFGSACGGGGGGTGTTNTNADSGNTDSGNNGTTLHNIQLIGVLQSSPSTGVGLTDLSVGDIVKLEFVGTDDSGRQVIQQGTGFSTNAPDTVATVTSDGILTVTGASATVYTVGGTGPAGHQTKDLMATSNTTFVTGRVRNINNTGVVNVNVGFYLANGTLRATATTGPNGTFRAAVPAGVTQFTIDIEQADPSSSNSIYYRQFVYNSKFFLNGASCLAKLPTITTDGTTSLATDIVLADRLSGPPPPPTGCLDG